MKKRNGFTLIELLAVIVILAIIALIATPMVLKYIEQAKEESFKASIKAVEKAAELKVLELENDNVTYPVEIDVQDLDLKNKNKIKGTVTLYKDSEGKYTYTYEITNGDYNLIGDINAKVYRIDQSVKLKFKTDNGIIDDENNYIYSFYTDTIDVWEGYRSINLDDFITVENGSIEFIPNDQDIYSTGAKIVLKDKNGDINKKYTVVIFGDINGDGWIDGSDLGDLDWYLTYGNTNQYSFKKYQLFAADVNRDGQINQDDYQIIEDTNAYICFYDNITYECLPLE